MRIAFFGSCELSCSILCALLSSKHEVVAVVTQPDQPAGRRMQLNPTPVCCEAVGNSLPVLQPQKVRNNPSFRRELASHQPEAFVTASYGQIISPKVLGLTEWPLNVHPSLLPKLRGASPVRTALLQGLDVTGCCIMRMTPKLDDGDVLARRELAIHPSWNHEQLEAALGELGAKLLLKALEDIVQGTVELEEQDHSQATYCSIHTREDAVVDWRRPAAELTRFIRAWDPDIGATTTLPDGRNFKIWSAVVEPPPEGTRALAVFKPGFVAAATKKKVWIATGEDFLRPVEVQPENKAQMPLANFLAGNALNPGDQLGV